MSANLDKSLDDLVGSRRQTARHSARRRGGSRRTVNKPAAVGGVKKSTKAAPKAAHPAPIAQTGSSKILVSGLVSYPSFRFLLVFTRSCANLLSLPMCPRPISRYVDLKALIMAPIAVLFLENLAAQMSSTRHATSLYLSHRWMFLDGRHTPCSFYVSLHTYICCWRTARLEVELWEYGEKMCIACADFHTDIHMPCSLSTVPRMIDENSSS